MKRSIALSIILAAPVVGALPAGAAPLDPLLFPDSKLSYSASINGNEWADDTHNPDSESYNNTFIDFYQYEEVRILEEDPDMLFSMEARAHASIDSGSRDASPYGGMGLASTSAHADVWGPGPWEGSVSAPPDRLPYGGDIGFSSIALGAINEQITFNSQSLVGTTGKLIVNVTAMGNMIHRLEQHNQPTDSLITSLNASIGLGNTVVDVMSVRRETSQQNGYDTDTYIGETTDEFVEGYEDWTQYYYNASGEYEFTFVFGEEVAFQLVSEALTEMGIDSYGVGSAEVQEFILSSFYVVDENGLYVDDLVIEGSQIFVTPIPEPSTYLMLGTGLGLAYFFFRRRNKRVA